MREVVTVQVGGFANFVGAHFWNFQDELLGLADDPSADPTFKAAALDMDVLYRAGDTHQVQYHPRSLYELHGSWTKFDKFDNYGTAREVVSEWSHIEEMNERLRFFVEECDHIQGIQFIVDDSGGFSCVAAQYLENIADDYTSTPVLIYCVRDPVTYVSSRNQRESITRSLHDVVSFSKLSSFCNLMVPIGLSSLSRSYLSPLLSIQDEKPFHARLQT